MLKTRNQGVATLQFAIVLIPGWFKFILLFFLEWLRSPSIEVGRRVEHAFRKGQEMSATGWK